MADLHQIRGQRAVDVCWLAQPQRPAATAHAVQARSFCGRHAQLRVRNADAPAYTVGGSRRALAVVRSSLSIALPLDDDVADAAAPQRQRYLPCVVTEWMLLLLAACCCQLCVCVAM